MNTGPKFTVYKHTLVLSGNKLLNRQFIVLVDAGGIMHFTDFDQYMLPRNGIRRLADDGNNRYRFVVRFLNYAFFHEGVKSLDHLTVRNASDFLNAYGIGQLPGEDEENLRTKETVEKCIISILDFLDRVAQIRKGSCRIKVEDLYRNVPYRTPHGKVQMRKVPVFEVRYQDRRREIFRDIPNDAFDLLFGIVCRSHPELLGLVALSAFAGLRPSEACNVRREDSPLGPGILFTEYDGKVVKAVIDLRHEYALRSDLMPVGGIKKERLQAVPPLFLETFVDAYREYLAYLEGKEYEAAYGPLSIDRNHRARTYDSYYRAFTKLVREELIPACLTSPNPEVVVFGKLLMEHSLSPHVFRHWYTVQLVLSGVNEPNELMAFRGDRSPLSALTYLQNKGELEKKYRAVSNELFRYLSWAAQKKFSGKGGQAQ